MELSDLTIKERLLLSQRVQHDSARFFHTLAATLEPADPKSTELLERLAVDERDFDELLARHDQQVPWPNVLCLNEHAIRVILHEYLPELYRWVAVRRASPENALKLARDIQREVAAFHQTLARGCSDQGSQTLLESFCEKERAHVAQLVSTLESV